MMLLETGATQVRVVLIVAVIALLLPLHAFAQSRPAPDTPGEAVVVEDEPATSQMSLINALRVIVVTSGIIGGFVAADIISGGTLTGPLMTGGANLVASATRSGAGAARQAAMLRPIIAGLPAGAGAGASSIATSLLSAIGR
ncbi:MAG: hypothetical protein WCK65_03225 [Rhodospirillaceae bacterium]